MNKEFEIANLVQVGNASCAAVLVQSGECLGCEQAFHGAIRRS